MDDIQAIGVIDAINRLAKAQERIATAEESLAKTIATELVVAQERNAWLREREAAYDAREAARQDRLDKLTGAEPT